MSRNKLEYRPGAKPDHFIATSASTSSSIIPTATTTTNTTTNTTTKNHIAGLYDLEQTIGQGHFAIVKSARHIFSGERVAIKIIDKLKLDAVSRDHLFQEVKCMKLVQHPNVVRLFEVIDTNTKLYLIQEFGDGGDMYDYIMKHSDGLDERHAKVYFRQIVDAIKYCHDLKVVHRDLKPENVVFFQQSGQVKLTDFGFSNVYEPGAKLLTSCGSLAYSAPEILLGDSYHAPPVDIWSLGVILYMLVTGRAPFQEASDSETLTMILDCKYYLPDFLSPECIDLISRMIVRDPTKRITLNEIKNHDWLRRTNETDESDVEIEHKKNLTDADRDKIFKIMIDGEICDSIETIEYNLKLDNYNYITATYYLLVEKLTKSHMKKRKHFNNLANNKRKILVDLQQPNVIPSSLIQSSSVLSKNQFKMHQRNLLMRQNEAKEEDVGLVEEVEEEEEEQQEQRDKEVEKRDREDGDGVGERDREQEDGEKTPDLDKQKDLDNMRQLGNMINNECESNHVIQMPMQMGGHSSRRSSRGGTISQSDNMISKLTIPEEDFEPERDLSPEMIKSFRDEVIYNKLKTPVSVDLEPDSVRLKPPKMSTDTSDSENEQNKNHEWTRSTSSSSRSRARIRSNTQFNRPLSVSSDNEHTHHATGQTPFNQKTLSVEHRLANMSQMSISSQLSKNNSFRFHRSTITGAETPIPLYNQQISSTTPTPRESIVFNRGDDKPIAKILQQMNNKSKSAEFKLSESETTKQADSELQLRNNNDSYSRAIKQSSLPTNVDNDDHKMEVPENKLLESNINNNTKLNDSLDRDINLIKNSNSKKNKKSLFCAKCCTIV